LTSNAAKPTKKYLNSIKGEIMEFQRTQHYDLMYTTTKELGYRVNCGGKNSCIEDYKGIIIVHEIN
jgi:DMSO/TMAO reductase YedYZ molybdopterin-dependent catalytic subunit